MLNDYETVKIENMKKKFSLNSMIIYIEQLLNR